MRVRLVVLAAAIALLLGVVAHAAPDCQGSVGSFNYDLSGLAASTTEVTTTDPVGQEYFYKVCGVVSSSFCQTPTDSTPAVCQKDLRNPPAYHDLGSQTTARFTELPSAYGGQGDGFTLSFTGGADGREAKIYFKCDPSAGVGSFKFVQENPVKTYDLLYTTKYACPVNQPPVTAVCCLYLYEKDPAVVKTLCSQQCPTTLTSYRFAGNWTVPSCADCFFHKK